MKKVAIIGASELQNPLIIKAKEMGYETHVFAWKAGDIGEQTADYFYPISITEVDEILSICRKIKPAAITSIASDLASITVNKIANALGLPTNPVETATIATNKYEMRKTFLEAGLPTPRFVKVNLDSDLSVVREMTMPIIVKPTDRSGSRGIFKVTSLDDLPKCVAEACANSFEKHAIIEEFIEGNEYSCECISQNGTHHFLAITKKFTTGSPHFIEIGHMEPSDLNAVVIKKALEQIFKALDALHVWCGASHSEFKVTPCGDIRLIEIGARMGGDCIGSDLVQLSTGYDYVKMTLQTALGEPLNVEACPRHAQVAAVRYIMNETDYKHYLDVQTTHAESIVRKSENSKNEGGLVTDSSTRHGFYIATGMNGRELCNLLQLPIEL